MKEIKMKIFILMLLFIGCGDDVTIEEAPLPPSREPYPDARPDNRPGPRPDPRPDPRPTPDEPDFDQVATILSNSCLGSNCHSTPGRSGVNLDSEEGFRNAFGRAVRAVKNGSMPLGRARLSAQQIAILENFGSGGDDD